MTDQTDQTSEKSIEDVEILEIMGKNEEMDLTSSQTSLSQKRPRSPEDEPEPNAEAKWYCLSTPEKSAQPSLPDEQPETSDSMHKEIIDGHAQITQILPEEYLGAAQSLTPQQLELLLLQTKQIKPPPYS